MNSRKIEGMLELVQNCYFDVIDLIGGKTPNYAKDKDKALIAIKDMLMELEIRLKNIDMGLPLLEKRFLAAEKAFNASTIKKGNYRPKWIISDPFGNGETLVRDLIFDQNNMYTDGGWGVTFKQGTDEILKEFNI